MQYWSKSLTNNLIVIKFPLIIRVPQFSFGHAFTSLKLTQGVKKVFKCNMYYFSFWDTIQIRFCNCFLVGQLKAMMFVSIMVFLIALYLAELPTSFALVGEKHIWKTLTVSTLILWVIDIKGRHDADSIAGLSDICLYILMRGNWNWDQPSWLLANQ